MINCIIDMIFKYDLYLVIPRFRVNNQTNTLKISGINKKATKAINIKIVL